MPSLMAVFTAAKIGFGFYKANKEEIHTFVEDAKKLFDFNDKQDLQKAIAFVTDNMVLELDSQKRKLDNAAQEMQEIMAVLESGEQDENQAAVVLMAGVKSLQSMLMDGYDRNLRLRGMVGQLLGKKVQTIQAPRPEQPGASSLPAQFAQ